MQFTAAEFVEWYLEFRPQSLREPMTQLNSSLGEWGAVAAHAGELREAHLREQIYIYRWFDKVYLFRWFE